MEMREVAQLVTYIALGDHRQTDEMTLRFWQDMVGDLEYQDCLTAVKEYRRAETAYLQPAHVRQRAESRARKRTGALRMLPMLEERLAELERDLADPSNAGFAVQLGYDLKRQRKDVEDYRALLAADPLAAKAIEA